MEHWITLAVGLLLALLALLEHLGARRTLDRAEALLDEAFRGDFQPERFSEARLSALETKLADHLSASALSRQNIQTERDKLQSLLSDISHQTKTPVANLLLYAQLLQEQDLPPTAREQAEAIEHQTLRLQSLMDALVKTSRLEAGILTLRPVLTPLWPVIQEAADQASPRAAEKGVTLNLRPVEALAVLDPKWTVEALYNLLDNAVKYTPSGGQVNVEVRVSPMFVRIDVADDGPGIPEAEHAQIFQRFYRSPAAAKEEGVGIGLYLTRQIAAQEGGYVKVFSRPGQGARFAVYLPAESGKEILQNC